MGSRNSTQVISGGRALRLSGGAGKEGREADRTEKKAGPQGQFRSRASPVWSQGALWSTNCARRRWSAQSPGGWALELQVRRCWLGSSAGVGSRNAQAPPGEAAPASQGPPLGESAGVRRSKPVSVASGERGRSWCACPPPSREPFA